MRHSSSPAVSGQEPVPNSKPGQLNGWTDEGIDRIIADPDLTAAAKLVAVTLIRQWAWFKDHCFPSDATIADAIGMSPGHVQRCLAELEQAGYIRRERTPRCRIIWLLWRLSDSAPTSAKADTRPVARSPIRIDAQSPIRPVAQAPIRPVAQAPTRPVRAGAQLPVLLGAQPGSAPARSERVVSELENGTSNVTIDETSSSHPHPKSEQPVVIPMVTTPAPPRPLLDELKAIPGADTGRVRVVANRLAAWLTDLASLGYYISVLAKAAAGVIPIEQLIAAFKAGDRAKESARRPGAIFCWTMNNWVKPPLPSEINRPVYYSAPTSAPNPGGGDAVTPSPAPIGAPPVGDELSPEEEIALWKQWSENKNHPFHYMAQQRIARLGGQAPTV